MSWIDGTRARLRLLFSRQGAELRITEEFRFHIEMETERLVREAGLDPQEARRRALVTFGGVRKHEEALRDGRGLAWLMGMSLDLKLGLRMLMKYPGLSLVGVLGMAIAVAISVVSFGIIYTFIDPTLPLDEGDRIVAIQNLDAQSDDGRRTHLHDLPTWREALTAVEELGAYRTVSRNFITRDGPPESMRIAEMTASGFRVARVPPVLGRYLDEQDEGRGAPPVVVIGYDVWQSRFAGEPDVVGRTLQLGARPHTIVGVMPQGFAFPVNHRLWTPLGLDPSAFERGEAPAIEVFGRLRPNATLSEADAQLRTIGQRLATQYPGTHEFIRPRIMPYAHAFLDSPDLAWRLHFVQLLVSMLLVVIGTNVAILVYARTATRMGEIAVRTALGASRSRIVAQISAEAMVLSAAAAMLGLGAGAFALQQIEAFLLRTEQLPFWMNFGISPWMILYVAGLAALATVVVGVIPALRATRHQLHASLQGQGPGRSGMRLGKTWTVLIVAQVAVAVTILPLTIAGMDSWVRYRMAGSGFAAEEYMAGQLHFDREGSAGGDPEKLETGYASLRAELVRRLEAEPGIDNVVLASGLPSRDGEASVQVEVDPLPGAPEPDTVGSGSAVSRATVSSVDVDFFPTFYMPLLTGTGFGTDNAFTEPTTVIVNRSFVQLFLGGGDPLGRRVRFATRAGDSSAENVGPRPWFEIVGVVPDFPKPIRPNDLQTLSPDDQEVRNIRAGDEEHDSHRAQKNPKRSRDVTHQILLQGTNDRDMLLDDACVGRRASESFGKTLCQGVELRGKAFVIRSRGHSTDQIDTEPPGSDRFGHQIVNPKRGSFLRIG